jgi:hypothetical protein
VPSGANPEKLQDIGGTFARAGPMQLTLYVKGDRYKARRERAFGRHDLPDLG